MIIAGTLIALFVLMTVVYVVLAIYWPELIGITGKRAKEIIEHHSHSPTPHEPEKDKSPLPETK